MKKEFWWKDTVAAGIIMLAVVIIALVAGLDSDSGTLVDGGGRLIADEQADSRLEASGQAAIRSESLNEGVYNFKYTSSKNNKTTREEKVYYSDSFFSKDNSMYNHQHAAASLALSMAGFKYKNAEAFLAEVGFEEIVPYRYDMKEDEDRAAAAFAHKTVSGANIIAVCIRGGNYGDEWGSNGRLSGDKTTNDNQSGSYYGCHYGFHTAADDMLHQLTEYAASHNIELAGSKIWLTGYSRGAAVANVLGEKLQEYGVTETGNVYCYTFAAPSTVSAEYLQRNGMWAVIKDWESVTGQNGMGSRGDAGSGASVPGIYNIVNPQDIVTRLPMNASGSSQTKSGRTVYYEWDYTKYGITIELPGNNTDRQVVDLLENSLAFATRNPQRYVDKYQEQVIIPLLKEHMGRKASEVNRENVIPALVDSLPGVTAFILRELDQLDFKAQLYIGNMISGAEKQRLLKEHWPEVYWEKLQ